MDQKSSIYSIGHGNKSIEDFIAELKAFGIEYLMDVRSKPYSKWNPHFNKEALVDALKKSGITYVFGGDNLGGLPEDRSCYDRDGKVVYDWVKEKAFFKEGLDRLLKANENKVSLAVMCSESKPEECHRSKLIGRELLKNDVSINHIVGKDRTKSQETVLLELNKGRNPQDLFGNEVDFTSRKSY